MTTESPRFFVSDDTPLAWDPSNLAPLERLNGGTYFAEVAQALDLIHPGFRYVLTKRLDSAMPIVGEDVIVFCLEDELGRVPAYAHDVRAVVKTYGTSRRIHLSLRSPDRWPLAAVTLAQEMKSLINLAPSHLKHWARIARRRRKALIIEAPPGIYLLKDMPFAPFEERPYDVWFAGSLTNELDFASLTRLQRIRQKSRARALFVDTFKRFREARPDLNTFVFVAGSFHWAADHATAYSESLMQAKIALCPRGNSLETYRVLEAMKFGCVIIAERLPKRPFYDGAPMIVVDDWTELPRVIDSLRADTNRMRELHRASLAWWDEWFSPMAMARQIDRSLVSG